MRECKNCSHLTTNPKFCSNSCAATYNNRAAPKRIMQPRFCIHCQMPIPRGQYCSGKCNAEHRYEEYINAWKSGKINGLRNDGQVSSHVRRYLFFKYDSSCCKCSWSEMNRYTKSIPLEIHHKDGNFLNNKEDNLELLCPNHHSLDRYSRSGKTGGRRTLGYM